MLEQKKYFMASAAPGVRYPNVYGIDMPSASELIAHGRSDEEVGELIGADWLIYQDLEDLIASASEGNDSIKRFECSVFDGEYVTGDVDSVPIFLKSTLFEMTQQNGVAMTVTIGTAK